MPRTAQTPVPPAWLADPDDPPGLQGLEGARRAPRRRCRRPTGARRWGPRRPPRGPTPSARSSCRPSYRDGWPWRIQSACRPTTEDRLPPIALVHDYFVQDGGAEAVALELARMFPDAPMHTTFFERDRFGGRIDPRRIRPWPLADRVPTSPWFRPLLPAYIAHFSSLEVPASRLVISNSSTFARGIHARRPAMHVAYVHSPMRFAWDVDAYLAHSSFPRVAKAGLHLAAPGLRRWDRWAGRRADVVVVNSQNTRRRIKRTWRRDSRVIHPPIDVAGVTRRTRSRRLLPGRDAAPRLQAGRPRGPRVRPARPGARGRRRRSGAEDARAASPDRARRFVGHIERARLTDLLRRCRALDRARHRGLRDRPGRGDGRRSTGRRVRGRRRPRNGPRRADRDPVRCRRRRWGSPAAIERFESTAFDPLVAREQALRFDVSVFHARWRDAARRARSRRPHAVTAGRPPAGISAGRAAAATSRSASGRSITNPSPATIAQVDQPGDEQARERSGRP